MQFNSQRFGNWKLGLLWDLELGARDLSTSQ
jgi:hypothetical protein